MARIATHMTCEDYHRLDVRELARNGLLDSAGTITWSRADRITGIISAHGNGDSFTLSYEIDGQEVLEQIRLSKTPLHLGGHRSWFLCPGCGCRIAVLYGGERFRCRHCLNLRYQSQRETPRFRAISRIQRVRMKLGGTRNLMKPRPTRPRYMHHRTYQRLLREEDSAWKNYTST
jgi:hypothetical protein